MIQYAKLFLMIASFSGAVGVALGAFGAHGLKARLSVAALETWQTAVHYQFVHTLALLFVAIALQQSPRSLLLLISAFLFTFGVLLFSGSLYGLALGGPRWLGPVTPLGGAFFIAGWISLFVYALRS